MHQRPRTHAHAQVVLTRAAAVAERLWSPRRSPTEVGLGLGLANPNPNPNPNPNLNPNPNHTNPNPNPNRGCWPAPRRLPLPPAAPWAAGRPRHPRRLRRARGAAPCTPLWRDRPANQRHGQPVARALAVAGQHGGALSKRRAAAAAARAKRGQPGTRGPLPPEQPRVRLGRCGAPRTARLPRCGAPRIPRTQPAAVRGLVAAAAAAATRGRLARAPQARLVLAHFSYYVSKQRCFGAPVRRIFPDHLITK